MFYTFSHDFREIFAAKLEMVLRVSYKNAEIIARRCLLFSVGQQLRNAVVDRKGGCRVAKRYPNKNGVFISEYPMYHAIFTYTPRLQCSLCIYDGLRHPYWFRTRCRRRRPMHIVDTIKIKYDISPGTKFFKCIMRFFTRFILFLMNVETRRVNVLNIMA